MAYEIIDKPLLDLGVLKWVDYRVARHLRPLPTMVLNFQLSSGTGSINGALYVIYAKITVLKSGSEGKLPFEGNSTKWKHKAYHWQKIRAKKTSHAVRNQPLWQVHR